MFVGEVEECCLHPILCLASEKEIEHWHMGATLLATIEIIPVDVTSTTVQTSINLFVGAFRFVERD